MQEKDPFDISSNTLKQVIPLMSQRKIPLTPNNYNVWYVHVRGSNPSLSEALDTRLNSNVAVDEALTEQLYERFIVGDAPGGDAATQEALRSILSSVGRSLATAGRKVDAYEQSLNASVDKLEGADSLEELRGIADELVASTQEMNQANAELQQHLEESRQESESLRSELSHMREQAVRDPLTGLSNRRGFEIGVENLRAESEGSEARHSLLIGDIDKFKNINDTYGHLFGDKIIKVVADAFSKLTKGKDLVARFGGEEFVILLPETDTQGAIAVAESIRRRIENGRVYNPKTGEEIQRVTISIGVAELAPGELIDETIERADQALYRAKQGGRNRVEVDGGETELQQAG